LLEDQENKKKKKNLLTEEIIDQYIKHAFSKSYAQRKIDLLDSILEDK
jgi:hypothetical protein